VGTCVLLKSCRGAVFAGPQKDVMTMRLVAGSLSVA
jgi:hypothetical protein